MELSSIVEVIRSLADQGATEISSLEAQLQGANTIIPQNTASLSSTRNKENEDSFGLIPARTATATSLWDIAEPEDDDADDDW